MSELDGVKQAIELVRNEVAQAKMNSELAQSTASDKVNELAMLGLEGVAGVLQTVADLMSTAVSQLEVAYSSTDECVTSLKAVTDKTKMSETGAALDGALEKLTAAETQVQGAGAQANDALTYAQESEVEPVMNAVAASISAIDQAKTVNETAKVKTNEYRTKITEAGKGLLTASGGAGDRPPGELVATVGDPAQAPQGGPDDTSPHQAELKSADDDDSQMSRFRRFSRAVVRNADSLHAQGKDTAKTGYDFADGWVDPYGPNIVTETAQPDRHQPVIHGKLADDSPQDAVGSLIVLSAAAIEVISRWTKHRSGRRSE